MLTFRWHYEPELEPEARREYRWEIRRTAAV